MKNLILIGMPGAGKSTVGVVLAKQQGYHFVDSDLVIQEQTGLLLHEIIEQQGDDGFRQVENRINAALGMKVAIKSQNEKSGKLEITYSNQDDLEKLMDKLMG